MTDPVKNKKSCAITFHDEFFSNQEFELCLEVWLKNVINQLEMASKHISHPWWQSNDPLNPPTSFHKSSIFCKKRLYTNVMKVNNQLFLILSVCLESLETRKVSLNNGTTSIVDRDAGHTDKLFIQLKSLNNSIALLLFCPTPTSKPILPLL